MFRTPVNCFFPDFLSAQNMVRVIEGKIVINDLRGHKSNFELAEGSSSGEGSSYQG